MLSQLTIHKETKVMMNTKKKQMVLIYSKVKISTV